MKEKKMHGACSDKIEYIDLLLEGKLSVGDADGIKAHIKECPGCRIYFNDIKAVRNALGEMELAVPAGLNDRIMKEVRNIPTRSKKRYFRPSYIAAYAAAACLVLAFSLIMFGNGLFMNKNSESAQLSYDDSAKGMLNESAEEDGRLAIQNSPEISAPDKAAVPEPENDNAFLTSGVRGKTSETLKDDGYMFSSYPFVGQENDVVNEGGINIIDERGITDSHDMVLVTASYSTDDVIEILFSEFGIRTERRAEGLIANIPSDMVGAVTDRLDLVAVKSVENDRMNYEVLIIVFQN